MILVTGATGQFGTAVIESLLENGTASTQIAALVRDENKAEDLKGKGIDIRLGDYNDVPSLEKALQGIDKLLLVSGNDIEGRMQQHINVVEAAKNSGVKHIVYTSFSRKNETDSSPIAFVASSHIGTEKVIRESGIPYTFLLNTLYADMLPVFFGEQVLDNGIFLPAGEGSAAYTTRKDMADAAAKVITSEGHEGQSYLIANSEKYTLTEAAGYLSELTGKTVNYLNPDADTYNNSMKEAGVPAEYIGLFSGFSKAIEQGEFEETGSRLEQLIGRKPTTLKEYLSTVYGKN